MGTHGHPWLIHVNVWQNQYSIVKQNKVKKKKDVVHIYNGILLSQKWNETVSFAGTWMDMESDVSQKDNIFFF